MGRLLQRLRRLLGQNAIRLSVDDLPAELRPTVHLRTGDRLEIGPRHFRAGQPIPGTHPPRVALLNDGQEQQGGRPWSGRIEGSELVLLAPDGESIRLPLRTLLHYPAADGSSTEEP